MIVRMIVFETSIKKIELINQDLKKNIHISKSK